MITKIKPDKQKSDSLIKMGRVTLERLDNTDMEKYPTNTLLDYYDVIHKLIEAITLMEGIKIKGEGSHQELIDYVAELEKIDEHMRQFLQQMRDYRNRISYEGFMINKNYISLNKKIIRKIIERLFSQLN